MSEMPDLKPHGWPIYRTWTQYEQIAMHFNDLLIRLRVQALGGVAALSTLVGIFTKSETAKVAGTWDIAAGVFGILCLCWIAIWILDRCYYNRLLLGSVETLLELEGLSRSDRLVTHINLSSNIVLAVAGKLPKKIPDEPDGAESIVDRAKRTLANYDSLWGVTLFYSLVFFALAAGFVYCSYRHLCGDAAPVKQILPYMFSI